MEPSDDVRSLIPALVIGIVLFIGITVALQIHKQRDSHIVLPGGITYLGPSVSPQPTKPATNSAVIPVSENATWVSRSGNIYPYAFSYPDSLSLGVFPNDPYDAVTVFYKDTDAGGNIFLRVEDLSALKKDQYVGNLKAYANTWWKDYAWTGVSSISPFINSHGLKGYRVTYTDNSGLPSSEHVFFSVPGNDRLVLWMSGKLFAPDVFARMVDSVSWGK